MVNIVSYDIHLRRSMIHSLAPQFRRKQGVYLLHWCNISEILEIGMNMWVHINPQLCNVNLSICQIVPQIMHGGIIAHHLINHLCVPLTHVLLYFNISPVSVYVVGADFWKPSSPDIPETDDIQYSAYIRRVFTITG